MSTLSPETLLHAYARGIFPMDDPGEGLWWHRPDPRAVIPLDAGFQVPRSLGRLVRQAPFEIVSDVAFECVMRACAAREETWISERLIEAYVALHEAGFAHSIECRLEGALVGGLYGVALGGAFFGESMFSHVRDASKVALVHLVERLRSGGFVLLDTQFLTPHLARFGAYEISRHEYERRLAHALQVKASWAAPSDATSPSFSH